MHQREPQPELAQHEIDRAQPQPDGDLGHSLPSPPAGANSLGRHLTSVSHDFYFSSAQGAELGGLTGVPCYSDLNTAIGCPHTNPAQKPPPIRKGVDPPPMGRRVAAVQGKNDLIAVARLA